MKYGIFSPAAMIMWCDSYDTAMETMRWLLQDEPETADEMAAIPVDETGSPYGKAIPGSVALQHVSAA
jgi:hypothetical protein